MKKIRDGIIWIILFFVVLLLFHFIEKWQSDTKVAEITYSEFIEYIENDNISTVEIQEMKVEGNFKKSLANGAQKFETIIPKNDRLAIEKLLNKNSNIKIEEPSSGDFKLFLIYVLPTIIIFVVFIYFIRRMQGKGNQAFNFGKSKAKMIGKGDVDVTFDDVAGCDEAKEELEEVIEYLKSPKKFQKLGGKIPKGILLVGPPGTGKTLLSKAVAGEANVPFLSLSGSDFVEMFVGVGASRVRDLFQKAKKHSPSIIFIDELDAVGRARGAGLGGGHDEREQTLNQLLGEMDGFERNEGIIVLAATNRPDVLDKALLRPGRFDRQVVVDMPDVNGREKILKIHTKNKPLAEDVDLKIIAKSTPGMSGADLANMANEAALLAAKEGKQEIEMEDVEEAKDKVLMGKPRKSLVISDEEKKRIAYHEAGHTYIGRLMLEQEPVHKVTIVPRGKSMGATHFLPMDEKHIYPKSYLVAQLHRMFAGRATEDVIFNEVSTGAQDDINRATSIARKMVSNWGMSDEIGPLSFGRKKEHVFLGRDLGTQKDISEETARRVDEAVETIVKEAYMKTKKMIEEGKDKIEKIAQALIEKEVLNSDEIDELLQVESGE
ncbi:MAG: ATP-dependent metallopeptidase FtsH/Yme1/Tma family protein [Candidatus Mcinerneyibacterium aminivorans]|uniref:ATP-dependent zinc metalloprotease FtsH n=1 Tax=Candidatus Mcinerneyibacterium aminivorans TaxID=2703815 RepID=A0A5D0MJL7_9BACT|nr:MAG: ATP-dependent metallopeptidase FtsH/Yme1/Tma family protein [Candidatus Mcinerneyibacterium aminivorans]